MSKILNKLKKNKISLDEYVNLCLYKYNSSYYEKKNIFGPRGDFITSPYISSIFGEMLAIYILNYFLEKKISNFSILEVGAGEGIMAKDIINTLMKFEKINFSYDILEKSKNLKRIQKKNLQKFKINWIKSLKEINHKNLFIVSNELFDAFPVKHLKKIKKNWYEKYVFYDSKLKKINYEYIKIKKKSYKIFRFINEKINFIEYSPDVIEFINQISKLLLKSKYNSFLTFDYGYLNEKFKNTLQGLQKHKKVNIFYQPGEVDITYLVNFNLIKKIFNKNNQFNNIIMSQSEFLTRAGIFERCIQAKKSLNSENEKSKLDLAVNRLIQPNQMGTLFKSLVVTNAN